MAKVSPIQTNFNGGEISPLLFGRPDLDKYRAGLQTCLNFIPLIQGPVERRPGTVHIVEVKTSSKATRLVRFEFSTTQAYVLEMGDLYFRVIKDNGQVTSGGSPVEVTTTYVEADLFELKFTQSADTLYVTHPSYTPRKITRTSDTAWTITDITFKDGPFLKTNAEATTLALSGTSGSVTVTASAVTGINGGEGFQTTDIGRQIRFQDPAGDWTYLTITARANTTSVTATIDGPNASAGTATTDWRLGVWSDTTGYPAAVTFHQNRLVFGGGVDYPQRIDMSRTGDFENFAPTELDGTVVDDNGVTDTFSADVVNSIRWLADDEKGLLTGTVGGEWITRPSDTGGVITPSNVQSKRSSGYGSANIQPIRAGRSVVFVQKAKRKFREIAYNFEIDGIEADDMTLIAEGVTRTGALEVSYQAEPNSVIWSCLTDGTLIGATYDRKQQVVGWHRHVVGGTGTVEGTQAEVESIAVIPNSAGTADELYMIVKRYINGSTVRFIEYMKPYWDAETDLEDAFFVDSGLTLDAPVTITGITSADPAVVTAAAHGFSDGDNVRIVDAGGMTEVNTNNYLIASKGTNSFSLANTTKITPNITAITQANPGVVTAAAHGLTDGDVIAIYNVAGMTEINGLVYTVANKTTNTFELSGINTSAFTTFISSGDIHPAIDSSAFTTYTSGGEVRVQATTVSGLSHLEGETVQVLTEGSTHPDRTVSSGSITLSAGFTKVHVGLGYTSDAQTLRQEAGAKDGTAQGKLQRFTRVILRFFQTLGGFAGPDTDSLDSLIFREGGDDMDTATPVFTGDVEIEWDAEYSSDSFVYLRQTQPLPMTLEAIMIHLNTQDR